MLIRTPRRMRRRPSLERDCCPQPKYCRAPDLTPWRFGVGNPAARIDDVLEIRLELEQRRRLELVGDLHHHLARPHRIPRPGKGGSVTIECARRATDAVIG